ncbi:MAG: hypothetical protein AAFO79_02320 [Pseudomonadota bacterium]
MGWQSVKFAMVALTAAFVTTAPAAAQETQLSDDSVKVLMRYAWQLHPSKYTAPDGTVITTNKSEPEKTMVPIDTARNVITVSRTSARAQVCKMSAEQSVNYRALFVSESAKDKWTAQQLLFIQQLHLFTTFWLSGNVKIVDRNGDKEVVVEEQQNNSDTECNDEQKTAVTKAVTSYVCTVAPQLVAGEGCKKVETN